MKNHEHQAVKGPDATVSRRYLIGNTVFAALVLVVHGTTLAICLRNKDLASMKVLTVLSLGLVFGASVVVSSVVAFLRSKAMASVMWVHAVLFSLLAVALTVWAVKLLVLPISAERFGWGVGALTGIFFYAFCQCRRLVSERYGLTLGASKRRANVIVISAVGVLDVLVLIKAIHTLGP